MTGLFIKLVYKICFSWPLWIAIQFTQYIEWFDAITLGLVTWFFSYAFKWGNNIGIPLAIAIGGIFLLLFHLSKIGFYISTAVFSVMWAFIIPSWIFGLSTDKISFWIVFAIALAGCAYLHDYAKWRKWAKEQNAAEAAQAKAMKAEDYESPANRREIERLQRERRELEAKLDELNRMKQQQSQKSHI